MKKNRGKIVTFVSTKGGVGKTITLLNFAGIYSNLGLKTLVIDLDLYGGAVATYLNSDNDRTIYNLVEDFSNNRYKDLQDYVFSYNENIDIIASVKDPRYANKIEPKYIPLILNNAVYKYDVILIDTTRVLDPLNIITIDSSDSILYMFTNDVFDLKNTKSFMSILKDISYDNVYTLLNNSLFPERNYFSLYDIRNITKHNIDYTIDKSCHIKNIDKYIMGGKILILNKDLSFSKKVYKNMENIAKELVDYKEGDEK